MRALLPGWVVACCCLLTAVLAWAQGPVSRGVAKSPTPLSSPRPPFAEPGDGGPSLAIFPPQRLTIRFDHQRHVTGLSLPCTSCHERAQTSRVSADRLLPAANRCDGCHRADHRDLKRVLLTDDRPGAACSKCHVGHVPEHGNRVDRLVLTAPNLKFNHAAHAATACSTCHGAVERTTLATRDSLPRMRACLDCHRAPAGAPGPSGACSTCHLTDGSRIRTQFPSGSLLPPAWMKGANHGTDWLTRHRLVAGDDSRLCANCHTEKSCADCHDGKVRPRRVHPNDYLSLHPTAARLDSARCNSCHQTETFCNSCHQRLGVVASGASANSAWRGRFHPPATVWSSGPRTPHHHAWQAERNLNACVSCHTERDCVSCHSARGASGLGIDGMAGGQGRRAGAAGGPHPPGFRARCGAALRKNARPCLTCHLPTDPNLAECGR